jgi:hypothetical protein
MNPQGKPVAPKGGGFRLAGVSSRSRHSAISCDPIETRSSILPVQIGVVLTAKLLLFPHYILGLLVISQSDEFGVPQMAHIGPLDKLKLPYELRL